MRRLMALAKRLPIGGRVLRWSGPAAEGDRFIGSGDYWESRYAKGGTSGAGSYGKFADFKAAVLNAFVDRNDVTTVTELGCGDGSQLSLMRYPSYTGLDVSETVVRKCGERFRQDTTKRFFVYRADAFNRLLREVRADLAVSLDVVYHLVEDEVFETYMCDLFLAARRYVAVYSTDADSTSTYDAPHVRHRCFTAWIAANRREWRILGRIESPLPLDAFGSAGLRPDFYFFERECPLPPAGGSTGT